MSSPIVTLNTGASIPVVGFGTWKSNAKGECAKSVESAINAGYRHIDCAFGYGNEKEVGQGIKNAIKSSEGANKLSRKDIFITSKLWGTYHDRPEKCLDQTLNDLFGEGFSEEEKYLDLYLVHWPVRLIPDPNDPSNMFPLRPDGKRNIDENWTLSDTWKNMEPLLKTKENDPINSKTPKVKAIGVSNVSEKKLEELLATPGVTVPAVNQIELHLYNPQLKLLSYLKSKNIVPQAYSPLGSGESGLLQDEDATAIAKKYSVQTADIVLGYLLVKGVVILPKSVTPSRIASNLEGSIAASKKLTKEDIEKLDGVAAGGKQHRVIMPPWGVDFGFENWPL